MQEEIVNKESSQLSQSEIMDKLNSMQEEMFMAGHNAALKSIMPRLKAYSSGLSSLVEDMETFLKDSDPDYEKDMEALRAENEKKSAEQLSQFTNRVVANLENVKN